MRLYANQRISAFCIGIGSYIYRPTGLIRIFQTKTMHWGWCFRLSTTRSFSMSKISAPAHTGQSLLTASVTSWIHDCWRIPSTDGDSATALYWLFSSAANVVYDVIRKPNLQRTLTFLSMVIAEWSEGTGYTCTGHREHRHRFISARKV